MYTRIIIVALLSWILVLLLHCVISGESVIVGLPLNVTVRTANTIELPCYTALNETVEWTLFKNKKYYVIYSADTVLEMFSSTGRFTVKVDSGFYNLTIINVTMRDAGQYLCNEDSGFGSESSVVLDVLGPLNESVTMVSNESMNTEEIKLVESVPVNDSESSVALPQQSSVTVHEMDSVLLSCYAVGLRNSTVQWSLHRHDRYSIIYSAGNIIETFSPTGRFKVKADGGFFNLTIANVTVHDAGEYICREEGGFGSNSAVVLHVRGVSILRNYTPVVEEPCCSITHDMNLNVSAVIGGAFGGAAIFVIVLGIVLLQRNWSRKTRVSGARNYTPVEKEPPCCSNTSDVNINVNAESMHEAANYIRFENNDSAETFPSATDEQGRLMES